MSTVEHVARRVAGGLGGRCVLVLGAALAGCMYEVPIGGDDVPDAHDAPDGGIVADPAATTLCEAVDTSWVSGTGPGGRLDGYHVFANVRGGECQPTIELVLTPAPALQMPPHPATVVITIPAPVDLTAASPGWSGMLPATISDGERAAPGQVEIVQATSGEGVAVTRLRAIATFAASGWQLTARIDTPYCLIDACPTAISRDVAPRDAGTLLR